MQPWASLIQLTLNNEEVAEYFQKDDTMKQTVAILDEQVLQTTTCTPKDVYLDVPGGQRHLKLNLIHF